jgi:hypothetical protein
MARKTRNLDPVLVVGLGMSVGLAVVFYLNTELAPAFATFAAMLGAIVTLQVEAYLRDRRRAERETRIERYPWLAEAIDEITASTSQIEEKYAGTIAEKECLRIFDDAKLRLKRLESGHFEGRWDDHSPATELIESAKSSIWATSVARADLAWWLSAKSRPYWAAQLHALERGVEIRRVFIYDEWSTELEQLARSHHDAGVAVRVINEQDLDNEQLKNIIGVWDGSCALRVSYSLNNEPWAFDFIVEEAELREVTRQFTLIEGMSVEIDVAADDVRPR